MTDSHFFPRKGPFTVEYLAEVTQTELYQPEWAGRLIEDVAPLQTADENTVSFFSNPKYLNQFKHSLAGACFVEKAHLAYAPDNMALLVSPNAYAAYALAAHVFYPDIGQGKEAFIHPTAIIHPSARIGKDCYIGPYVVIGADTMVGAGCYLGSGCVIEHGVEIGEFTILKSSVTLAYCVIGHHCILHPGVRVGQDGFGYAQQGGQHIKVPQLGRVFIGHHVEIGANSCIDRGAGPDTIIGDGCKIDNLVQIGHNVVLGKGCIVVAQVGIAGSTTVGDYVVLGGQVGIAGHLSIGSMVHVAAQSGVIRDVEPRKTVGGTPAVPIKQWHRQSIALKRLVQKEDHEDHNE
jgi:UDP-3-O-[3-hydroxymyristoyl] glucosamine N-acyltransferase